MSPEEKWIKDKGTKETKQNWKIVEVDEVKAKNDGDNHDGNHGFKVVTIYRYQESNGKRFLSWHT